MILGVTIAYVKWCIDYGKKKHTQKSVIIKHIDMSLVKKKMVQGVPKSGTRCPEQDMGRIVQVSNGSGTTIETFSNTISIPLAIAGSIL